ncbi:glycosyltransferase family 9 protein [Luteolibacter algae]|uniref:Glycosyltransferase family 9 protein n=1 Tax=Luteolibacter algae TaxID=454151 RepID=A0ABW5D9D1_9BACT
MNETKDQEQILVIKLGALGDIILAMEGFHAIRAKHPGAQITLLTRPPFVKLTSRMPWFDHILEDSSPRLYQPLKILRFRKELRKVRYDRVYDLQGNDRTGLYFRLIGPNPPEWCGTAKGCSHQRHDHRKDPVPATERIMRFLESVDVRRAGPPELDWLTGNVEDLNLPEKFVMFIPGCAPQHPHKRWPARHFAELAERLSSRSLQVVAVGTNADQEAIAEIQKLAPNVINLAGKTDIGQLAEVGRRAQGAVGNDTGPVHIAAIVGTPTISLMSAKSDPLRMIPRGPDVGWLQSEDLEDLLPETVFNSLRLRSNDA